MLFRVVRYVFTPGSDLSLKTHWSSRILKAAPGILGILLQQGQSLLVMTAGGLRILAHGLQGRAFCGTFALARGPGFGAGWLGSRGMRRSGGGPSGSRGVRRSGVLCGGGWSGSLGLSRRGYLGVGTPGMRSDMSDMSDIARKRVCKSEVRSEGGCACVCGAATVYACGQPATIH